MFQFLRPRDSLSPDEVDGGLHSLLFDGVAGQVMLVLCLGPFLVGFALLLGASNKTIGLLAAIGPLAQLAQVPSIYLVERLRLRKLIVVFCALVSRLCIIVIAVIPWVAAPAVAVPVFLAALLGFFAIGAVGGCAFNSWLRDFVPQHAMARFFARRLTLATLVGAMASMAGGLWIDYQRSLFEDASTGYSILFAVGACAGLVGVFFLARTPEPRMPAEEPAPLIALIREPFTDRAFRQLLVFLGSWSFAVNFAGPFFAVYLLTYLNLSMTWVLALSVLSQVFNVLFFGLWGRLADAYSNKSVLMISVPLFFFSFLLWPFTTMPEPHFLTFPLLIAIHCLAGISTAGVALCAGNLGLKLAPFGKGGAYLAVNALVSGLAATVAPIVAGFAADGFAPYQLNLTLQLERWEIQQTSFELPTMILRGLDFIFIIAFLFGLYSLHRLLAITEEGEVSDEEFRQAFFGEMRRMARQVSTVAGVRQLVFFPFVHLANLASSVRKGGPAST